MYIEYVKALNTCFSKSLAICKLLIDYRLIRCTIKEKNNVYVLSLFNIKEVQNDFAKGYVLAFRGNVIMATVHVIDFSVSTNLNFVSINCLNIL